MVSCLVAVERKGETPEGARINQRERHKRQTEIKRQTVKKE